MMPTSVKRLGLAVGLSVIAAQPALAQERVALVTATAAEAPAGQAELGRALTQVVAARGGEPVDAPLAEAARRLGEGAVRRERLAGFARSRGLIGDGWRAYLEVRHGEAAARLRDARDEAERLLDLDGGPELYAEISLRRGVVLLEGGHAAEAATQLRLAAALDPELAVTDDEFKRSVVDAFRAAVAARPALRRRSIEVTPAGARVEIDGRAAGTAPIALELGEGQHAIVVRADGHAPLARVVEVAGDAQAPLRFQMAADPLLAAVAAGPAGLAPGTRRDAAAVAIDAVLTYAEADTVLLAAAVWRRRAPTLLGQWCSGTPVRCTPVVEIGFTDPAQLLAATQRLWRQLHDARRTGGPSLLADDRLVRAEHAPGQTSTRPRRWYKSPWLWLGTAGAAIAVTSVILLSGDRDVQPIVDVDPCMFGGDCP